MADRFPELPESDLTENNYEKQTRWSNDKTIIELSYCQISWLVCVSQINCMYFIKVTGQTWLPLVSKCTLDLWLVLSQVRFWEDFPFWSKCREISLLNGVDLLILIMEENTQIYWMEVFLSCRAICISSLCPLCTLALGDLFRFWVLAVVFSSLALWPQHLRYSVLESWRVPPLLFCLISHPTDI